MGAVSDVVNMGSWGRMRMWLLAIAVAILGTHALQLAGLIDITKSIYVRPNVTWLSYVLGGLLFGIGMTLGSGCGSKTLVRMGGGSLKSLVVFTFLGSAAPTGPTFSVTVDVSNAANGGHTLYAYARSSVTGHEAVVAVPVFVGTPPTPTPRPVDGA